MIKYFIRTTGERDISNYNVIDYTLLIDKERKPVKSFIDQLKIISDYDSVLLEDDVLLCRDFEKRINEAIEKYPNKIINFFQYFRMWQRTYENIGKCFESNQCTYYPKGVAKVVAEKMEELIARGEPYNKLPYDYLEAQALDELQISYIIYRPMLVQHIGRSSIIGNPWHKRDPRSLFFIDILDDNNINYEDTREVFKFDKENRKDFYEDIK